MMIDRKAADYIVAVVGREEADCNWEADYTWEVFDKAEADSMLVVDYPVAGIAGYMIVQIEEAAEREALVVLSVPPRQEACHNYCRTAHLDEPELNN